MHKEQVRNSAILVFSNLIVNLSSFLKQLIMAYFLGISSYIDILLLAQIIPAIFQSMIGGGAGEVLVIKREKPGYREGSFEITFIVLCLIPVAVLSFCYFFSLGFLIPFFDIEPEKELLFKGLTLIFLVNALPGTFTSVLRPHLYSMGLYSFYAVSTVASHIVGIGFILTTINSLGIYAFAWGTLIASFLNAIWFSFRSGLPIHAMFSITIWKHEFNQLIALMKRVFSLSIQTFLNYFVTFWERSLSIRYLSGGYLSSLNYSKTLSELPSSVILSSILTSSYIEQVNLHKNNFSEFEDYTLATLKLLMKLGFLLQILMLIMAPVLIILVLRRGKFDNEAVSSTLIIFNILTISFVLKLLMSFFSRTMYILGEYRRLLQSIFFKFLGQLGIMVAFIATVPHTIPIAIVFGHLIVSSYLFFSIRKKLELPSVSFFINRLMIAIVVSAILLVFHSITLKYYIERTNLEIFLFSLPLVAILALAFFYVLKKNGIRTGFTEKLKILWLRAK